MCVLRVLLSRFDSLEHVDIGVHTHCSQVVIDTLVSRETC